MTVMTSPVELAKPRALEIGALSWLAQDGTFARLPAGMFWHHDGEEKVERYTTYKQ